MIYFHLWWQEIMNYVSKPPFCRDDTCLIQCKLPEYHWEIWPGVLDVKSRKEVDILQRQRGTMKSEYDQLDPVSKWCDSKSENILKTRCFLFHFSCYFFSSWICVKPKRLKWHFMHKEKKNRLWMGDKSKKYSSFMMNLLSCWNVLGCALSQSIFLSHFSQTTCPWSKFPPKEGQ